MASTKTRVKPIRISNESAEYFERKPLNRMVESLSELLKSGKITFDGENLKAEGVYTEKNSEKTGLTPEIKEIESMANFFGLTLNEMLKKIYEGLNDGTLTIENGRIVGVPEVNLEKLEEACHERGIGMQEAIDKTVKNLRSGK